MKKRKYNNGGELLKSLLPVATSLIPGGQYIAPFINPILNQFGNKPQEIVPQVPMSTNPFGRAFGGPITPMSQESTYVQPQPFLPQLPLAPPVTDYRLTDQFQNQQMRSANTYNPLTGLGKYDMAGGTGKVKSNFRFREKAEGGFINDDFKQYHSSSHASGNDTQIDQFGNPVEQGVASIQNKENMYKGFIFSDTLSNPETGNKFNTDAIKINKKYKNARLDDITKSTLDFEMNKLQTLNQEKINKKVPQNTQMYNGGKIRPPQMPYGDPMDAYNQADELVNYKIEPFAMLPQVSGGTAPQLNLPTFNTPTNNPVVSNTTERSGLGTLDAIGLGLKGAALVGSISDAVTPALKEDLILPDYSKADNYIQSANIDYSQSRQDAVGVSNIASNNIRSMSGNAGQYLSRQSGRVAQLQDVLGRISEQENNQRANLNMTKGQYESNKAIDTANRQYQNQQNNFANESNANLFDRGLSADFASIGKEFGQEARAQEAIANNRDLTNFTNTQILAALSSKYGNFQVSEDIVNQFKEGKIDINQLLKFKI